jgi:hypothetical protein
VENEELSLRANRKVPGTSTIVEIPVTGAMQPNVWAVFEILAEGSRQMVEVPLRVPKIEKRLKDPSAGHDPVRHSVEAAFIAREGMDAHVPTSLNVHFLPNMS